MEQSYTKTPEIGHKDNPTRLNIVRASMEVFHVPKHWFFSRAKNREYVIARKVAVHLCRKYGASLPQTAQSVGYVNHTSALSAERSIKAELEAALETGDEYLQKMIDKVDERARVLRQNDLQEIGKWAAAHR